VCASPKKECVRLQIAENEDNDEEVEERTMREEAEAEGGWGELQTWLQKSSVYESKKVLCASPEQLCVLQMGKRGGHWGGGAGDGKRDGIITRNRKEK
jgi:hypothetical protein